MIREFGIHKKRMDCNFESLQRLILLRTDDVNVMFLLPMKLLMHFLELGIGHVRINLRGR